MTITIIFFFNARHANQNIFSILLHKNPPPDVVIDVMTMETETTAKTSAAQTHAKLAAAYQARSGELTDWATRKTGNREDAEDLLHEAFAATIKGVVDIERLADPLGWIFTSLRNKVIDLWRTRARRQAAGISSVAVEALEEIVAATGLEPAESLERNELVAALNEAIAALPKEQRQVIEAQVFRGQSFRQLASETGISIDTLSARKRYGIEKIAKALRAWYDD
jgi:RNA polymerase sigma factor (sigma-70 family)